MSTATTRQSRDRGTRRRSLTARHQKLLADALAAYCDDQESRELLSIVREAEEMLVDLPEGSRWT